MAEVSTVSSVNTVAMEAPRATPSTPKSTHWGRVRAAANPSTSSCRRLEVWGVRASLRRGGKEGLGVALL